MFNALCNCQICHTSHLFYNSTRISSYTQTLFDSYNQSTRCHYVSPICANACQCHFLLLTTLTRINGSTHDQRNPSRSGNSQWISGYPSRNIMISFSRVFESSRRLGHLEVDLLVAVPFVRALKCMNFQS